jgi:RimJ/RimL family protein N-acetyltransferase
LAAIFDYPFNVCQVKKIIVPVGSDNEASTRMVSKMGFFQEGCIKDARPEGDIVFWTMQRNDCKYLKDRYGKKVTSTTTAP